MAIGFAEGAVTKLRREFKLVLSPREAAELAAGISAELSVGAGPPTRITSVYFDRPGSPLAERARRTPDDCLKVRTKEYFPDYGSAADRVVLEVKRERGGVTQKRRVWLPRAALREVVRGPRPALLPLIAGGRLLPTLAVTYVREVFQSTAAWRITMDRDIRFHAVDAERALGPRRLTSAELPAPFAVDERVVVEVKHQSGALPAWLEGLSGRRTGYSKFAEGTARCSHPGAQGVGG